MFKVLTRRLQYCNEVSASIKNAAPTQLQQLKTQLAEDMVKPVGLHTMGIPAAVSTLGVIVSFAIPQLWLGYGVLAALGKASRARIRVGRADRPALRWHQRSDDVYDWQR